ncbi:PREDICTED: metacaspase-1-like [Ipomoea nil]|uniref:metacaspase-1-like n=1 Tax=Ipomoea nil TaxID=35883 RepID=UPI0009015FD2|nr:PREDICTED: metacaspase-1-like [Ipomoea nil]
MAALTCNLCGQELAVPPHSRVIRCRKCNTVISLGDGQQQEMAVQEQGSSASFGRRRFLQVFNRFSWGNSPQSPSLSSSLNQSVAGLQPPRSGKRALLCGVTYKNNRFKVRGSLQDVKSMQELLLQHFSFQQSSILVLAEEKPYIPPTRKNIIEALKWLMKNLQPGDSLVFYFSGHGFRQPNFAGDELDGFDETICPLDFRTEGMILDNAINDIIVKPLAPGIKLHAIVDACHSGTVLDLPRLYKRKEKKWTDNKPPSGACKSTNGGMAICLSACQDYELAADTNAFSSGKDTTGAMTYTLIKAIKEKPNITYAGLLDYMHEAIEAVNRTRNRVLKVFQPKMEQEPALSSSEDFNINQKLSL